MSELIEPTGHPDVDAVLGTLAELDDLPVEEHVAVFEHAHERLRSALEARPPAGDPIPPGLRPGG
ncbi:conserved hypothetical protein [metagenome]|uniref:Uncharacterized protein n=1 Tax=metagenome TaxID=256318 RepID=A0A2P2CAL5_9ZZZZ